MNPKTGRPATPLQGILLLIGSCLPILGAVLLAPILPTLSVVFADSPASAALVPLILTIPALFIAVLAPFAGAIVDKIGRKQVLIIALLVYTVVGTAPAFLHSLGAIVATRAGVGITEAFIMTCCTTMIADYFTGNRRNKILGLQALVTSLAATVFFVVGGALAAFGWRTPFWVHAISLLVALVMIVAIWPTKATQGWPTSAEQRSSPPCRGPSFCSPPLSPSSVGDSRLEAPVVELPYVPTERGVAETATIGMIMAGASLATALGAFSFRFAAKRGVDFLLPLALAFAGLGQLIVALAPGVVAAVVGSVVAGLGTGLLLPTMITWSIARLGYDQRGRGTGLFTGALFLGEFFTPLVVLALTAAGSLSMAIGVIGGLGVALCVVLVLVIRRFPQPSLVVDRA